MLAVTSVVHPKTFPLPYTKNEPLVQRRLKTDRPHVHEVS